MSTDSCISGSMRPLLRRDVIFGDTGFGVYVRGEDEGLVLQGKTVYKWLKTVAPLLDGKRTMDELRSMLSKSQREMLEKLVVALADRNLVRDDEPEDESVLPIDISEKYASQISFIHHFVTCPRRRFDKFRNARVVAVGDTAMLRAAVKMLHANGNEAAEVVSSLDGLNLDAFDAVLVDCDAVGASCIFQLERHAKEAEVLLIPAMTLGQRSFVGPALGAPTSPRWATVLARLAGSLPREQAIQLHQRAMFGQLLPYSAPSHTLAGMLGTMLGFDIFRYFTGCLAPEVSNRLIIQNHETMDLTAETVLAHPLSYEDEAKALEPFDVDEFVADLDAAAIPCDLRQGPEQHDEVSDYMPILGFYTGLIHDLTDDGVEQSPVKVSSGTVVQIVQPGMTAPDRCSLSAFNLHTPLQARCTLVMNAAIAHAETWGNLEYSQNVEAEIQPQQLVSWLGSAHEDFPDRSVVGVSLRSGATITVPAAAAFPLSPENRNVWFESDYVGTGAGRSLASAAREAILSAISDLALREALKSASNLPTVDLSAATDDSDLGFLRNTLNIMELSCTLVDVSRPGLGATMLGFLPGVTPEVRTAPTMREAAVEVLTNLVGRAQTEQDTAAFGLLTDLDTAGLPIGTDTIPHNDTRHDSKMSEIVSELKMSFDPILVETTTNDLELCSLRTVRVLLAADSASSDKEVRTKAASPLAI